MCVRPYCRLHTFLKHSRAAPRALGIFWFPLHDPESTFVMRCQRPRILGDVCESSCGMAAQALCARRGVGGCIVGRETAWRVSPLAAGETHQLKRPRRDLLAGRRDADHAGLAPPTMRALQRRPHHLRRRNTTGQVRAARLAITAVFTAMLTAVLTAPISAARLAALAGGPPDFAATQRYRGSEKPENKKTKNPGQTRRKE